MGDITIRFVNLKGNSKAIIADVKKLAQLEVARSAQETVKVIQRNIESSIKRLGSTGRLANAFFAQSISPLSWGVGNISYLNDTVPYWRHVNYGSLAIGANWRHLVPTGGFNPPPVAPSPSQDKGRWGVGQGSYSFVPNKPIPPHNFIQRTVAEIPFIVSKVINRGI